MVCFEKSKYIVYKPYLGLHVVYHAKKFCFSGHSKYQKIDIIDNEAYGRMLFLDDNLQHTSYDSQIFNEALCGTAKRLGASKVLVLGGGSGQTVLAMLKSPLLKRITIVEIDPMVVDCCMRFVKGVNRAFNDSRVRLVFEEAGRYLHTVNEEFDASIIDFTEKPFGTTNPAKLKQFYTEIKEKCKGKCSQYVGSVIPLAYNQSRRILTDKLCKEIFSNVRYEDVFIPSFGAPHRFMHAGYDE